LGELALLGLTPLLALPGMAFLYIYSIAPKGRYWAIAVIAVAIAFSAVSEIVHPQAEDSLWYSLLVKFTLILVSVNFIGNPAQALVLYFLF